MASWTARLQGKAVSLTLGLLLASVSVVEAHPSAHQPGAADQATQVLAGLSARYQSANAGTRAQMLGTLTRAADSRQQLLAGLIQDDPGAVLRVALPSGIRGGLPASVRAYIEEHVQLEGLLEVIHEDRADGHRYLYDLHVSGQRFSLYFAAHPPTLQSGARVRVRGVRVNQALALDSGSTSLQALSVALPNTFGQQRTLVMLVSFSDTTTLPYTADYARDVVFNTTSQFDLENSFQQTWLTGDVVGWLPISLASTVCDYSTVASAAKTAATAAGVSLSSYTRYVYAFPKNACTWWGLGTVGGNPSQAWINGSLQLAVVGHEMGHNFGLYHSHAVDCGTTTLGTSCTDIEYGDTVDIMGSSSKAHFNAFQKERLGWLNYGSSPPIATALSAGTYTIDAYETPGTGPKALKILKSTDPTTGKRTWYYVEYRQAIGFDSFLATNTNVSNGVLIHTGSESTGNSSNLLDLTPATASWADPALLAGQSFTDPGGGVTIMASWVSGTQAGVTVSFGGASCVQANPTVALSPAQSQWVAAGTTITFSISVTNNDSATCGAGTFNLQPSVPAGWSAALASPSLTVNPGAALSTTLQVTSPAGTPDAFYTVGASATDAADSSYTGSASAAYVVSACGRANPTVVFSPAQGQSPAAGTVAYTLSMTNNDTTGCAASTFTVQPTVPSGWNAVLANSSFSLSPGAAVSTTVQVTSTATSYGTYTIRASGTNTSASSYSGTATATYMVVAPLNVSVTTDQPSYARKQTVVTTALVMSGTNPVAGATVSFTVRKPNGVVVQGTGTTGSNGSTSYKMRLGPRDPVGVYQVQASASASGSMSGVGTTSFTLK